MKFKVGVKLTNEFWANIESNIPRGLFVTYENDVVTVEFEKQPTADQIVLMFKTFLTGPTPDYITWER